MMVALSKVLPVARVSRNQFNDWIGVMRNRKILRTRYAGTDAGVSRNLTRANALELAFTAALARGGLPVNEAVARAFDWLGELADESFAPLYALNPHTSEGLTFSDRSLGFSDFAGALSDETEGGWGSEQETCHADAAEVVIIDRAAIVARVDRLFPQADADDDGR